jgi:hypothetical protein
MASPGTTRSSMAQAKVAAAESRRRRGMLWSSPLVAGLCFGLAYGVTHRLSNLNVGDWGRSGTGFDVQPFPGTSLESLKLRFGAPEAEIRGDLERQELERQEAAQDKAPPTPPAATEGPAALDGLAPEPAELPAPEAPAPVPAATAAPPPPLLTPPPAPSASAAGQP